MKTKKTTAETIAETTAETIAETIAETTTETTTETIAETIAETATETATETFAETIAETTTETTTETAELAPVVPMHERMQDLTVPMDENATYSDMLDGITVVNSRINRDPFIIIRILSVMKARKMLPNDKNTDKPFKSDIKAFDAVLNGVLKLDYKDTMVKYFSLLVDKFTDEKTGEFTPFMMKCIDAGASLTMMIEGRNLDEQILSAYLESDGKHTVDGVKKLACKGTDGKGTDGKGTDGKGTDGKGTDGKGTDGKGTDGKGTDGKGTDGKGTDGKGTDGKGTDGKGTDGENTPRDKAFFTAFLESITEAEAVAFMEAFNAWTAEK